MPLIYLSVLQFSSICTENIKTLKEICSGRRVLIKRKQLYALKRKRRKRKKKCTCRTFKPIHAFVDDIWLYGNQLTDPTIHICSKYGTKEDHTVYCIPVNHWTRIPPPPGISQSVSLLHDWVAQSPSPAQSHPPFNFNK